MNKKRKKIQRAFYYAAIIPLVLVVALFVGAALPWVGNYQIMTVLSGSMEPAINPGDVVVVSPQENYETGEIITFTTGGDTPTTHRLVDTKVTEGELAYITKGDANPTEDMSDVREEDILGAAVFSIPLLGYVVEFARTPLGFVLLIGLPAILIIAGEVKKIYKEVKTTDEE